MSRPMTPMIKPTIMAVRIDSWVGFWVRLGRVDGMVGFLRWYTGTAIIGCCFDRKVRVQGVGTNARVADYSGFEVFRFMWP
jgi:hypothetical protein